MFVVGKSPLLMLVLDIGKGGILQGDGFVETVKVLANTYEIDQMKGILAVFTANRVFKEQGVLNVSKKAGNLPKRRSRGMMLKPYMGYSRAGGSREGAVLVFAHDIKEAKRIAFGVLSSWITDEYTDMAVTLIKNGGYLFEQVAQWSKDKIAKDEPHVVDSPPSCKVCELWGNELNEAGLCEGCQDEADYDIELATPTKGEE